jgi:hypothetical protein
MVLGSDCKAITQAQFGDADPAGFERFPNQLAAHTNLSIMVS